MSIIRDQLLQNNLDFLFSAMELVAYDKICVNMLNMTLDSIYFHHLAEYDPLLCNKLATGP